MQLFKKGEVELVRMPAPVPGRTRMLAEGAEHKNHASARLPAHAARRQAVRRRGRGRDGAEERSRAPPQVGSQIVLDEPEVDGRNVVRSHRGKRTTARAPDLAAALLRMRAPGASVRKGAWTCPLTRKKKESARDSEMAAAKYQAGASASRAPHPVFPSCLHPVARWTRPLLTRPPPVCLLQLRASWRRGSRR